MNIQRQNPAYRPAHIKEQPRGIAAVQQCWPVAKELYIGETFDE